MSAYGAVLQAQEVEAMPQRPVRLLIAITILCLGGITGCETDRTGREPEGVTPLPAHSGHRFPEIPESVLPRNQLRIQISAKELTLDPPLPIVVTQSGSKVLRVELELLGDPRWQKVQLDGFRDVDGQAVGVKPDKLVLTGDARGGGLLFTDPLPTDTIRLVEYDLTLYTEADDPEPDLIIDPVIIWKP